MLGGERLMGAGLVHEGRVHVGYEGQNDRQSNEKKEEAGYKRVKELKKILDFTKAVP
jgi:hypothetical protein